MDKTTDPNLLNELFNAHLINNGLRRAYLKSPSTKTTMIEEILKMYPKLKISHESRDKEGKMTGWWLSKRKIPSKSIDTDDKIGRVLGYRNKVPLSKRDWNARGYFFRIKAHTKLGIISITQASDAGLDFKEYYEDIAKSFEKCLKQMPVYGKDVKKVVLEIDVEYTYGDVINMMVNYKKKYKQDRGLKNSIVKYMTLDLKSFFESLDLDNELHRGIIIGLRASTIRSFSDKIVDNIPFEDIKEYSLQRKELLEIV